MDGIIGAAAAARQAKRDLMVIMASTLTRRNAEITLQVRCRSAPSDYVPKPETNARRHHARRHLPSRNLIQKIRHLGRAQGPPHRVAVARRRRLHPSPTQVLARDPISAPRRSASGAACRLARKPFSRSDAAACC